MTQTVAFGNPNDPHLVASGAGFVYSMPATNGLMKKDIYDSTNPIVGDLAQSWSVTSDGLTYTFKLHQGVKFHNVPPVNGRELTAEDVKYSLMRITAADPSMVVDRWKPRFQRRLDFGSIDSIETPDKYTLIVTLKEPYAPFMDAMAHPGTQILPREFVEKFPEKVVTEGMIGTGPYLPVEYRNQQLSSYKSNPDYWRRDTEGNPLPYLDELALLFFSDKQSEIAAFRARQLEVTQSVRKSLIESVKRDEPNVRLVTSTLANLEMLRFNMSFPPFQDVRVRSAISLAVDRHQFVDLIAEGQGAVSGPLTPVFPEMANTTEWLLSQPGYRKDKAQDIEQAKRLMEEARYPDGFTMSIMSTSILSGAQDTLTLLGEQLKPLKITTKGEAVDYVGQWVPRSLQGEFELSHMSYSTSTDPDSLLSPHMMSNAPRNYGKYSDPILDDLIKKERTAISLKEREKLVREAETRILDQAPIVVLYNPTITYLAQPWTRNISKGVIGGSELYSVEYAWIDEH